MDGLMRQFLLLTICAATLALASGCHLFDRRQTPPPAMPPVLAQGASLEQVIGAVNNNSRQIQSFSTNQAELSGPGIPVTLRNTNIVFERPKRLRIQAGTGLTGSELDVGSNDELFWFWVRRNEPPAVFFCRHSQYASCEAARMIPIEPGWLIETFGIVEFAANEQHQGPFPLADGRLEIHTRRETPCGPAMKKTVLDASTAVVYEQHLYDYQGQAVASAVTREHHRDPLTGVIMPKVVDLQCPRAKFSMRINLGNATINGPLGNPAALWSMPSDGRWPIVDLTDPNWPRIFGRQSQQVQTPTPPPGVSAMPSGTHRGFNRLR